MNYFAVMTSKMFCRWCCFSVAIALVIGAAFAASGKSLSMGGSWGSGSDSVLSIIDKTESTGFLTCAALPISNNISFLVWAN